MHKLAILHTPALTLKPLPDLAEELLPGWDVFDYVDDLVVLAQASMVRVLPKLPGAMQEKFLSSPRSGMERLKQVLEGQDGALKSNTTGC